MNEAENGVSGNLQALFQEGLEAHQSGRLTEAEAAYRKILDAAPGHADANHLLGVIALQVDDFEAAVDLIGKAIEITPTASAYHCNLGNALYELGRLEDAAASQSHAIELDPDYAKAHNNLGNVRLAQDRFDDAVDCYRKALTIAPDDAEAHANLGTALRAQDLMDEAEASYRRAIEINPNYAEAHTSLGNTLQETGRLEDAVASHQQALALNPEYAEAHTNLGNTLKDMGRFDDAVASYEHAISLKPDLAGAHTNLGLVLQKTERLEDAAASHRRAIEIDSDYAEAHTNLGMALQRQGHLEDAVSAHKNALAIRPDFPEALNNLGGVLNDLGDLDEAIALYKQAITLKPDYSGARCNYLHTLLYLPDITNNDLFDAYREAVSSDPSPVPLANNALPTGDRLRIGYLSSDFGNHPVGRNIEPLLSNHDHERFEIFCYAELATGDDLSKRFRDDADHWRITRGLPDAEVARRIRDDGIHVMVYLGGHFDENRPSVATFRPAPVQVAMHGGATTALDGMDFWLTDAVLHPDTTTEQFSEELFRLPNFYAYPAPDGAPPVLGLPAEDNGFVTFASFNKPCKINPAVIALWSRVLAAVPQSRLMLKFKNHWDCPTLRDNLLGRFEANRISPERIDLISAIDTFHDHLACYHKADIALDLFPFAGATTTFQALWMGVPVVSRMGERFSSRAGGSITTHAGLGELAVDSDDAFVERAQALAGDLARLAEIRATLRQRLEQSPLCDGPAYAANVEDALRAMWEARAS